MADQRECVGLEVPRSPEAVEVLGAALADALSGRGPAIALLPEGADTSYARRLRAAVRPGEPVPPEVAVVAATSGSTGDPAGVLIPGLALRAAADGFAQLVAQGSAGTVGSAHGAGGAGGRALAPVTRHRWVAALPLHHAGGLMVLVRALVGGSPPVPLSDGAGSDRPFLDGLGEATQTAADLSGDDGRPLAISLVPAQLVTLRDAGPVGLDVLRRFDVVLVGGAATPAPLLTALRAEGVRVRTSYGMTETCGGAVFDGVPLPGTEVSVDGTGRLRIVGEQVARGYRDGREPDRWFRGSRGMRGFVTGDLGSIEPSGTVRVAGRRDDVVQVGGASVAVAAIADVLAADPAVREVEVVAVEHARLGAALVAFVVPAKGACTVPPTSHEGAEGSAGITTTGDRRSGGGHEMPSAHVEPAGIAPTGDRRRGRPHHEAITDRVGPEAVTPSGDGAGRPTGAPVAAPVMSGQPPTSEPTGHAARHTAPEPLGARTRLTDRLTAAVVDALGPAARPRRVLLVPALPLAETGKRDRAVLQERARLALTGCP